MVSIYKNASVSGGLRPPDPRRGFASGPHWGIVSPRPSDSFCSAPSNIFPKFTPMIINIVLELLFIIIIYHAFKNYQPVVTHIFVQ